MSIFKCEFYTIGNNHNNLEVYRSSVTIENADCYIDAMNLAAVHLAKKLPGRILITKNDLIPVTWDYSKVIISDNTGNLVNAENWGLCLNNISIDHKLDTIDARTITLHDITPRFHISKAGLVSDMFKYNTEVFPGRFIEQIKNSVLDCEEKQYCNIKPSDRILYNHPSLDARKATINAIKAA